MNYFELFDIPVSFSIDKSSLAKKYFELQKQSHPDFHTQSSEDEQMDAIEKSSMINKAFKTFQNRDETIKYVLQLKGLIEENEKYELPPDFLMEVMELNENMNDSNDDTFKQFEDDIYEPVKSIIDNYNNDTATADDLQKIKEYYYKKKYLNRILDRMHD